MILKILKHPRLSSRLSRLGAHKAHDLFTWTGIAQQFVALGEHQATESPAGDDIQGKDRWNDSD
jgi:hypothetical protein